MARRFEKIRLKKINEISPDLPLNNDIRKRAGNIVNLLILVITRVCTLFFWEHHFNIPKIAKIRIIIVSEKNPMIIYFTILLASSESMFILITLSFT